MTIFRARLLEALSILLTIILSLYINSLDVNGALRTSLENRSSVIALQVLLTLTLYLLLRLILPSIAALIAVVFTCFAAFDISYNKYKLTERPVSANDFYSLDNALISIHFASWLQIVILSSIVAILILSCLIYSRNEKPRSLLRFTALCAILSIFYVGYSKYKQDAIGWLSDHGVKYASWDQAKNFNENGVLIHLFQTSARSIPPKATPSEREKYKEWVSAVRVAADHPKNFIMILCESCWYDEKNFKKEFAPLLDLGPAELRGLSPIYGGGTPNATLEFLSSLPMQNNALYGVFYQEYGEIVSREPDTLPFYLSRSGISSYSLHNFHSTMYKRSAVEPRLGFSEFIGLEKMNNTDTQNYFPRDYVVYNAAKDVLSKNSAEPTFMHIATVYTHGPYAPVNGDNGYNNYGEKIATTAQDAADFIRYALSLDEETVIFLYGDHKPPMWDHFKDASPLEKADVPILLFDKNKNRANEIANKANGKPFYCYSTYLANVYYGLALPAHNFTHRLCDEFTPEKLVQDAQSVPHWLYFESLLGKTSKPGTEIHVGLD